MELDYKEWMKFIQKRKEQIEEISLEDEKYNSEFVNLSKIEDYIRKILKEKI